ncbi:hypothetical protein [Paludibacterium purpuratum]|uniref:Uncharacterized protein n=1 Tax=Paludibacterium purpuratum TaxID=1144873 RepID=A0A4R7B8P0_9NEIS|nr:hypothetical protein [Paludibacterium purpuratum]TDR80175.1 hypothetical protein DFP86_10529 [Paludibacterium purpuratum]
MPILRLLANTWPIAFSCQLDCLRRQQVFLRSQWFFNGRTAFGAAPMSDKFARIQRRWLGDVLSLLYDWGETQRLGCRRMQAVDVPEWWPWLEAVERSQRQSLDGLVDVGRCLLCTPAGGIDPEGG